MAESPRAAALALTELENCAPQRDFAAPVPHRHRPGEEPVPVRWHNRGEVSTSYLVACVQVLLARHLNRSDVTVLLKSSAKLRVATATVAPNRSFAQVVRDFATRNVDEVSADVHVCGAMIELMEASTGGATNQPASATADISFRFQRGANILHASIAYNRLLYRDDSIASLARQLAHMLSSLSPVLETDTRFVSLFDRDEFHRIVYGFNDNRASFPRECTLSHLIEVQGERTPDERCAVHGDRSMTYEELNGASSKLAALLQSLGVGRGSFVAILDHRGLEFVIGMVAIWKAGGAYVPVDPSYPEDRVRYMLSDSEATVAIVGAAALTKLGDVVAESSYLKDIVCQQPIAAPGIGHLGQCRLHTVQDWQDCSATDLDRQATAADPAYMIYTSGSTGRPKGAVVRHGGAVNHLFAQAHSLGKESIGRFLQTAPSSSDISVWQFAAPLVFGGLTVIVDDATDVEHLLDQVQRHRIQIIELVPVVMRYLVDYAAQLTVDQRALPSLRWAMVTGESASVELVNAWLTTYPRVPVVNAYGPTEAADDVAQAILHEPLPANQLTVPIGRSLANMDVYVLDDHLQPAPIGALGEICVAGVGVGCGYWHRPEQTRQCFVPNPFAGAAGPTIYRTGDIGRLLDDGSLECLGRRDQQVKLRGFRIELQEIEAVLCSHPKVANAVARVFHDSKGDGRLVAYVVAKTGVCIDSLHLHSWLAARLPPAMVPSAIVPLTKLPLNPAGKIDRNALPPPGPAASERTAAGAAPQTAQERVLASLWQQELGVDNIGSDDNFFDLGGDSLSALAIVLGARAAGLHIRPGDILLHPTVARLARATSSLDALASPDAAPSRRAPAARQLTDSECRAFLEREIDHEAVHPLSPPQQGIFLHWLLCRDKTAYVDQYSFSLVGPLSTDAFGQAWAQVAARHPVLRTAFLRSALSEPAQAVLRHAPIAFEFADYMHLDAAASDNALHELMTAEVQRGFALARPPLSRITLVRVAPNLHRLVWTHHHIVIDGWSMSLVLGEVLQIHAATVSGRAARLPAPTNYQRYIEWLDRRDTTASESFWREQLDGFAGASELHVAGPREPKAGFEQKSVELTADICDALKLQARAAGVTLGTLLQAAWACLLSRRTDQDDVVFGVVTSGRELDIAGIDAIVGLFAMTLPLRVHSRQDGNIGAWLVALQSRAVSGREHADISLSQIARCSDLAPGRDLFETLFVMSNYPAVDDDSQKLLSIELAEFRTVPAYPLSVIVSPSSKLALRLVYDSRRFDAHAIEDLSHEYAGLIGQLARGQDPRPLR